MTEQQIEQVKALIAEHSNDELSKEEGMVYQVWEDGEITLQKSGSLLWQRNLHCTSMGYDRKLPIELFPHQNASGHGYMFSTREGCEAIRAFIREELMGY